MPQEDPGRWSVRELRAFLAARDDATCAHATEKKELADRVRVLLREQAAAPAAARRRRDGLASSLSRRRWRAGRRAPRRRRAIERALAAADAYEALSA